MNRVGLCVVVCVWFLLAQHIFLRLIHSVACINSLFPFIKKRFYLFIFRERGREEEREGGRETSISCLPQASGPGIEPVTQACALTRK